MTLYRIPPERLAPYMHVTALEMQQRYARARFEALLGAAQTYLAGGGNLDTLNSHREQVLRTLPQWFGGSAFPTLNPNKMFQVQWALGQWHPGRIALGVQGSYAALQPLIAGVQPRFDWRLFSFSAAAGLATGRRFRRIRPDGDGVHPRRTRQRRGRVARPGVPP